MLNLIFRTDNCQIISCFRKPVAISTGLTLLPPPRKQGIKSGIANTELTIQHEENAYLLQQPISPSLNLLSPHQPLMKPQEHQLQGGGQSVLMFLVLDQRRYPSNLNGKKCSKVLLAWKREQQLQVSEDS